MIEPADIRHRFEHHPPTKPGRADLHAHTRRLCLNLAQQLNEMLPASREASLAITNLEQVMFWANAAIARQP